MRFLAAIFCVLLWTTPALAGEFGDAAVKQDELIQSLQDRIEILESNQSELDARLGVIEEGGGTTPQRQPPLEPGQMPYVALTIPGLIEAEAYDEGGNGIAYYDDSPGNIGGAYRLDDVDIKEVDGIIRTGWNGDDEWTEYTVLAEAGMYDLWLRVSNGTTTPKVLQVSLDGTPIARVSINNTGSWDTFTTLKVRNIPIAQDGYAMLRFDVIDGPFDVDWAHFVIAGTALNRAPTNVVLCETALTECVDSDRNPVRCIPDATNTYCVAIEPIG